MPLAASSGNGFVAGTTTGTGATTGGLPPKSSAAKILVPVALALLMVGGGLIVAVAKMKGHDSEKPPITATPPTATSAAPVDTDRVVDVAITPADATVEVDHAPATVHDGKVSIKGALGSVHSVHVTSGGREKKADVVISAGGAAPSSVDVPPPAPSASTSTPVAPHLPRPVTVPAATPVPAVKPTGPTPDISRTM
jgi:hypothetical protein